MKKNLLTIICLTIAVLTQTQVQAQRYWNYVFPSATVTPNITYASNYQFYLSANPALVDLKMDIYEPGGMADPLQERPLIIYLHTGIFLPIIYNSSPTGTRGDSATVEMCKLFARRGFVAASVDYRLGWVPQSTDQDVRTGTLLQAVYRAIQDTKACVRYFRKNAGTGGNTYGVDTNNIILVGQGSGGYIALGCATLYNSGQISLPKFISNTDNNAYSLNTGLSYVNQIVFGDFEGYGGIMGSNNPANSVGYSSEVDFVCNMGGAIGDISWLEPGNVPMVGFHVPSDPFAPYANGIVTVPGLGYNVVAVSGDSVFIPKADSMGNNACFANNGFTDPYTTHANTVNGGNEGLYPLYQPGPQAAPWEWFDSTTTVGVAIAVLGATAGAVQGPLIYQNALQTNPDMSKTKALAYIDTIQNYLVPRIIVCRGLVGIEENNSDATSLQIAPNPASNQVTITLQDAAHSIKSIELVNVLGEQVYSVTGLNTQSFQLNRGKLDPGVYLVRITTDKGNITRKLIFE